MPTEPLTDSEIAELRRLVFEAWPSGTTAPLAPRIVALYALMDGVRAMLPRLLDELDLLRRRDREWTAGEEVLRQQLRDAGRRIEMPRVELGERGR